MKLTTKSEYAILALLYLARAKKGDFVKIKQICKEHDIDKKYLEQLFEIMKQDGLIEARRGIRGGYRLIVLPEKMPLARVIRLMDGALAPTKSVSRNFYSITPLVKEKKALKVFGKIRDYIAKEMERIKLADLM